MTIVINGTTGISGVDGSAGTPAVQGTDTNTGVFYPAADTVGVSTGGSERMRIDSSGNVGIGTSSPGAKLDVANGTIQVTSGYGVFSGAGGANASGFNFGTNLVQAYTSNTERMRIDSSGNVGIGTTNPLGLYNAALAVVSPNTFGTVTVKCTSTTGAAGLSVQNDAGTSDAFLYSFNSASGSTNTGIGTSKNNPVLFYQNNTERMRIDTSGNLLFNSGYGSVATAYGCRAWVNFNGTTASPSTIRASGNVTSVTKNTTGDYTLNFTNALPDANYAVAITASAGTNNSSLVGTVKSATQYGAPSNQTTTACQIVFVNYVNSAVDTGAIYVSIFR